MIDWNKRVFWTVPEYERPSAGEWDGSPEAMPERWKGMWTVVVPGSYRSPVTKEFRDVECLGSVGLKQTLRPGASAAANFYFWTSRRDKVRPVMFRSEADAVSAVRAFAEWTEAMGWFELPTRKYDAVNPEKSTRLSKSGKWLPFAKAVRMSEYEVFVASEKRAEELAGAKKKKPTKAKPVSAESARNGEKPPAQFSQCRFLDFDPDCLEKRDGEGAHGIVDGRTSRWLRYSAEDGKWTLAESKSERTTFPDREKAASALCAIEQRLWMSEYAALRPAVAKV